MWLINVSTLKLEFDIGEHTIVMEDGPQTVFPCYAILSHRWGQEEVTFQEFQDLETCRNKIGFRKIAMTCQQAKKAGLDFAWVDTCCIDKSSSAELQEAINSMFDWYARSAKCYVYLDDVDAHLTRKEFLLMDGHQQTMSTSSFDVPNLFDSQWFSRGWTLQELIGPEDVRFFDSQWIEVGSRDRMSQSISEITGIDKTILAQRTAPITRLLEQQSAARRMSWAAKRSTTRPEDRAYCLLGLFDIKMPLLYGEGHRAFFRLQEEIMKHSRDLSLLAWSRPAFPHNNFDMDFVAESPADFQHSADYIRCELPFDDLQFYRPELTAFDCRVRVPVMLSQESHTMRSGYYYLVALLAHRRAGDPTRVVGIRVRFSEIDKITQQGDFGAAAMVQPEIPDSPLHCFYDLFAHTDRLVFVDILSAMDRAVPRELVIATEERAIHQGELRASHDLFGSVIEYAWIRFAGEIASAWKLVRCWPNGSWDNTLGICNLTGMSSIAFNKHSVPRYGEEMSLKTSVILEHTSGLQIAIVCSFRGQRGYNLLFAGGRPDRHVFHIELYTGQDLESLSNSAIDTWVPRNTVLHIGKDIRISLATRELNLVESRYCVIEPLCEGPLFG